MRTLGGETPFPALFFCSSLPASDVIGKETSPGAAHFAGHAPYSKT